MTDEGHARHVRSGELFREALGLPPGAREAFLRDACGDDAELASEVRSLLEHDALDDAGAIADVGRSVQDALDTLAADTNELPESIGEYRVLSRIGSGGMGVVYEAEQKSPRRRVALKVIRPGLATPSLLRRFEHEAEVLGWLDHPGIARIFEAGTADTGAGPQPFFAMELVRGEPLHRYASRNELGIEERLALIALVADAVQHAHQKGVVHRDLKPGNVLVDGDGRPKVLDFGVARVTDLDAGVTRAGTALTNTGELVGTLPYMSPEQVGGNPARVDARSDVYALGAIAYELLSGRLPHAVSDVPLPEAARRIAEDDPPTLGLLDRRLRGDVDTIVGRAMEKEPERRYASIDELASDIRRYLHDEPIVARPPSTIYQLRKFTRRNRGLVGGLVGVVVVLIAGIVGVSVYALRAEEARADAEGAARLADERRVEAEQQATRATSINDFLNDELLAGADPSSFSDPDLTVLDLLDRAYERLAEGERERFAAQPLVRASVLETIGRSYLSLSRFERAEESLAEAHTLYETTLGSTHANTLIARLAYVDARRHREHYGEVVPLYEELRANLTDVLGADDASTRACVAGLAKAHDYLGDYDLAAELFEEALAGRDRTPERVDGETLGLVKDLALVRLHQDDRDAARTLYEEALAGRERLHGSDHILTARARASLAGLFYQTGDYTRAIELYVPAVEVMERVIGDRHEHYLVHAGNLGLCYSYLNRLAEAEPILRHVLDASAELFGEESKATLLAKLNLAAVFVNSGRYGEAIPLLEVALEGQLETLGEGHDETLLTMNGLGVAYSRVGRMEDAERIYVEVLELRREHSGLDHPATIAAASALGYFYSQQRRSEEAAPLHAEAVEGALRTMPDHMYTGVFLSRQAVDFYQTSRFSEAAEAGAHAHRVLEGALGAEHARTKDVARLLGDVYTNLGDEAEAERWRELATAPAPAE